jgi:hypothetical protein
MPNLYEHLARYHADQHYDAHMPHLRELRTQAGQSRTTAARGRRTRLGALLVALRTWLLRSVRCAKLPAS